MTEKIRLGMIGVGGMAQEHIRRLLRMPEVEIAAIVDPSDASIANTHAKHGAAIQDAKVFPEYKAMLDKIQPDAVVVCTPHTLHFEMGATCLSAGAHVLMEKPMVTTVSDAHALMRIIKDTGKVFGIGYQRHAQAEFRYIKAKIESGEFGKVQFIQALNQQGWAKATAGTWRQDPALSGGGQINDTGSHLLDIIQWCSGLAPAKVAAFMDNCGTPVDINSALSILFTNGAQGNVSIMGNCAGWYEDITVWCENGAFYVRQAADFSVQGPDGKHFKPTKEEMPEGSDVDTNFLRAIRGEEEIAAQPLSGLRTIELTEAAWESGAAGGALTDVKRA